MELQTLRFFVTAAEAGSFSQAAIKLKYAQSNLSSRVKQLEDELGTPLFYRHHKGITLTAKGKLFYQYASKILHLADEAVTVMHDTEQPQGNLYLGSLEATALGDLPHLLSSYHKTYPSVQLSLQVDMNDFFLEKVLNRSLDGAFVANPEAQPEVKTLRFKTEQLVLVGTSQAEKTIDEILTSELFVTFPTGSIFRQRLELLLTSRSISYSGRLLELNSLGAMIANICAGIGFGYLPQSIVAPHIARGQMQVYPFKDAFSELNIEFIYRQDHIMDAAFRQFLAMLQNEQQV